MNRREFLAAGAVAGLATALPAKGTVCGGSCMPKLTPPAQPAQLNLCLQWGGIPVQDDVNAKLDYLEQNGFQAVEIPSGLGWLQDKGRKVAESLKRRKLFLATACGPSRFDYADKAKNDAEVEKFMPVLEILGEIKSVGLIICPARGKPEVGLKELREDFVTNTGKRIAQKAAACGTSIVLEPLQRAETPFLRQVSDGAKMAQEIGPGCAVMADLWHMSKEEPSQFAAIVSAGPLLKHVHVASLVHRRYPGTDGAADNYVDAFKGLKLLGYRGAVSMEAGPPEIGRDAKNKPIYPDQKGRSELILKMVALLREQWEMA
ncbi:MAG: sugar phosphate isomerase/epimerase family protein [Kiritimatiellia bacterium]